MQKFNTKQLSKQLSSREFQDAVVVYWTKRCSEILQERHNLSRDDLEYTVKSISKLKDERLKSCIAELIGWGDDERAELETFCAIALEAFKLSSPARLREAAMRVEMRYLLKGTNDDSGEVQSPDRGQEVRSEHG
jgi:hypothetical protein